jgi:Tfp pilus assembly protein PilV
MTTRSRTRAAAARSPERGFTLAETAIALAILMIASVGVLSLFTYAIQYNTGAKDRELSMAVAQKRVEWLRSIPFDSTTRALAYHYPDATDSSTGGLASGTVTDTMVSGGRSYTVVTTIANDGGVASNVSTSKTITIQVTPAGANTAMGRVTLVTRRTTLLMGSN